MCKYAWQIGRCISYLTTDFQYLTLASKFKSEVWLFVIYVAEQKKTQWKFSSGKLAFKVSHITAL